MSTDGRASGGAPLEVPILTYHSLDDSGSVVSMPPAVFAHQMRTLADRGFTGVRMDAVLDAWAGKGDLPERPIALTFDDGFANFEEHGAPVLEELGFRATIFAIAGLVGGSNTWPAQAGGIPEMPLLSWPALSALVENGFEVGAHTLTHPVLPRLSPEKAAREVVQSGRILEDRLGCPVRTFAYPFGHVGTTRAVVADRYEGACGTRLGTARRSDDPHELPRIDMYYLRHPAAFRLFGNPAGRAYIGMRRVGHGIRTLLERAGVPLPG